MTFFALKLTAATLNHATLRLLSLCGGAFLLLAGATPQADPIPAAPAASAASVTAAPVTVALPADSDTEVFASDDRPLQLASLITAVEDRAAAVVADDREARCLAIAVYFESRGEPLEGQLAVAQAIRNRVASGRYAPTICGVIDQPGQFGFDRSRAPRAGADWTLAQAVAHVALEDMWPAVAPNAMSFHATRVAPDWGGKARIARIGRHIFYR